MFSISPGISPVYLRRFLSSFFQGHFPIFHQRFFRNLVIDYSQVFVRDSSQNSFRDYLRVSFRDSIGDFFRNTFHGSINSFSWDFFLIFLGILFNIYLVIPMEILPGSFQRFLEKSSVILSLIFLGFSLGIFPNLS